VAKEKICGVYEIRNIINNKVYIGSSYHIFNRWSGHRYQLNKNIHNNIHLQRAWNKYGKENFKFKIIEEITIIDTFNNMKNTIIEREQYWIDKTNCFDRNIGYNIALKAYSKLGVKDSEETKIKKSKAMLKPERRKIASIAMTKTNNKRYKELGKDFCINYTKLNSDKVKQIDNYIEKGLSDIEISNIFNVKNYTIANIRIGKTWNHITNRQYIKKSTQIDEHIAIIIAKYLKDGYTPEEISNKLNVDKGKILNIRLGVTFSNITGIVYNTENKGKKIFDRRKVIQLSLDGQFIKEWNGLCEIEEILGYNGSSIANCCKNKNTTRYVFNWVYKEDYESGNYCKIVAKGNLKPIVQLDLNDNLIKIWVDRKQIEENLGISSMTIKRICNGNRKLNVYYDYKWMYQEDYEKLIS